MLGPSFRQLSQRHLDKKKKGMQVFPGTGHRMCKGWWVWMLGNCTGFTMAAVPWGRSPGQGLLPPGKITLDFTFPSPVHLFLVFPIHVWKLSALKHSGTPAFQGSLVSTASSVYLVRSTAPSNHKAWMTHWKSIQRRAEMGFGFQGCTWPCIWLSFGVSAFRQYN